MEELFQEILAYPSELIAIVLVIFIILSTSFRRDVIKVIRLFFYRDDSSGVSFQETDRLAKLEKQLEDLERGIASGAFDSKKELIEKEISIYLDGRLSEVIESKIQDADLVKGTVIESLKQDVRSEVSKLLKDKPLEELESSAALQEENRLKIQSHKSLIQTLNKEASSASTLKMVMINLFVVSTFAFLVFNIFNNSELPRNSYFLILGVYFSLGAFMLYIIRTSHFRSSVLLAIKEDERNHQNAIDYLRKIRGESEPTEHDVDIIRLIMTNRSEREHKADHPYEVILKGVSGTNIQFKGGKMTLGKNAAEKA